MATNSVNDYLWCAAIPQHRQRRWVHAVYHITYWVCGEYHITYWVYAEQHSNCNAIGVDANSILAVHNSERAAVRVPPLVWNNSLAAAAQTWPEFRS